jgi:hypothetical protein
MSTDSDILYEKLIYENEVKFYQLRLTVSEFRGIQYVNVRKYFLSYEGDYVPSKEGISMEASMTNVLNLLDGLMELCSKEESKDLITKHFGERISDLNKAA